MQVRRCRLRIQGTSRRAGGYQVRTMVACDTADAAMGSATKGIDDTGQFRVFPERMP